MSSSGAKQLRKTTQQATKSAVWSFLFVRLWNNDDRIHAGWERQDQAMALFIRTLKKQPEVLDAWSDTIWTVMVEKVLVHKDGGLTFGFYNGSEICVVL